VAAAFEERERKSTEVGFVVESGCEEDGTGCEAGEMPLLVLIFFVVSADVEVLHVVVGRWCGTGTEVFA